MAERITLRVPAAVLASVAAVAAGVEQGVAVAQLIAEGARVLAEEDGGGPTGDEHQLAMALGDELFYSARLVLAQLETKPLRDEVWDLEEQVYGERPADPPAELPDPLPTLADLSVDAIEGDEAEQVECLCYGVGGRLAAASAPADRVRRRADALSRFAAAKFHLSTTRTTLQTLGFRRAGLLGLLDGARLREDRMRPPQPTAHRRPE